MPAPKPALRRTISESLVELETGVLELDRSLKCGEDARPLARALGRIMHGLKDSFALEGFGSTGLLFHSAESCFEALAHNRMNPIREFTGLLIELVDLGRRVYKTRNETGGASDQLLRSLISMEKRLSESHADHGIGSGPGEARPGDIDPGAMVSGDPEPPVAEGIESDPLEGFRILEIELLKATTMSEFYRLVVGRGRVILGIGRLGLLLYDGLAGTIRGTWGTNERGEVIDEGDYLGLVDPGDWFIKESIDRKSYLAVSEDRDITYRDRAVGRGWIAMISLRDGSDLLGWIAADNLLGPRPLLPLQRWHMVVLGQLVSNHLNRMRSIHELVSTVSRLTEERNRAEAALRKLHAESQDPDSLKERLFSILCHDQDGPIGAGLPLLENLLEWLGSQLDGLVVRRERVELSGLFAAVLRAQGPSASHRGVILETEVAPGSRIDGDPRILEAILRNLLSNAVKLTQPGGRVRIRAVIDAPLASIRISVEDQGPGMGAGGLGLGFCADLARKLGAVMGITGEAGKGSVLTLTFPAPGTGADEGESPISGEADDAP